MKHPALRWAATVVAAIILSALAAACSSSKKEVLYLQDRVYNQEAQLAQANPIKVQPGDELQINVSSRQKELAEMFNLRTTTTSGSGQNQRMSYLVTPAGNIDFPVLGEIHVEGMTRVQLAAYIKGELMGRNLLQDPVVVVSFANLHFTCLGEVGHPGEFTIDRDQVSILEAIAMAGDLTIYGERDKVYVVREVDNKRTIIPVDLRSTSLFDSPAFFIHQGDIIVVEPNGMKAGQRSPNENWFKNVGTWMSIITFITTMVFIFVKR